MERRTEGQTNAQTCRLANGRTATWIGQAPSSNWKQVVLTASVDELSCCFRAANKALVLHANITVSFANDIDG